jgi:nucleotide-binding universal stress UspA family protein
MEAQSHGVVVAAVDRSEASEAVVVTSPRLANALGATELHFVHVIGPTNPQLRELGPPVIERDDARLFLEAVVNRAAPSFDGSIVPHVRIGPVRSEILRVVNDLEADLLVVGSHPKAMLEKLFTGSVSRSLMRTAPCPVYVARPKLYPTAPAIEPPCPGCVEVQRASNGAVQLCAQHDRHPLRAHLHYEIPPSYGVGAMFFRGG